VNRHEREQNPKETVALKDTKEQRENLGPDLLSNPLKHPHREASNKGAAWR
jgi:hypothetical protein